MRRTTIAKLFGLFVILGEVFSSRAEAQSPVLIRAAFFSHTNDEGKEHDTGIYFIVTTDDGTSTIAHADNRDSSADNRTQYKTGSEHTFDLDLNEPRLDKESCQAYKVHMYIHTHSYNTWHFSGRVVLYFSDKTNITATLSNTKLKDDWASLDFVAPHIQ